MLFKLLKLFGLDVRAKVAEARSVIEQRAEEVAQYAGQTVQTAAVIAALSALAGVLGAMAVGVGLYALYRVDADTYGVYTGLGVVGGVLVAAALILFLIARAKGQSLSSRRIFRPLRPIPVAASSPAPVVATADPASVSYHAPGEVHPETARVLLEPLAFLLPKYIKYPALGDPVLDELVENLGATARETADEAVERVANLVRHGDRQQLLVLLGGAAFVGWLLARQNPDMKLRVPADLR
jgi:hypothetical protein